MLYFKSSNNEIFAFESKDQMLNFCNSKGCPFMQSIDEQSAISIASPNLSDDKKEEIARSKRDDLLDKSDYTQLSDAPVNAQAWADYRQALRDLPEQSGFPGDITWPIPPE